MFRILHSSSAPWRALALLLALALLGGCSDDGDPAGPAGDQNTVTVTTASDTFAVVLDNLPTQSVQGSPAIPLDEVVTASMVAPGTRDQFVYRFEATDGFSPIQVGRPDLEWSIFQQGFLAVQSHDTWFPTELALPGAYNVRELAVIHILAPPQPVNVNVVLGDDSSTVNLRELETVNDFGTVYVPLEALVSGGTADTVTPSAYTYRLFGGDGFSPADVGRDDLAWDTFNKGRVALETRNVEFPDSLSLPGAYNVTGLARVVLFPAGS